MASNKKVWNFHFFVLVGCTKHPTENFSWIQPTRAYSNYSLGKMLAVDVNSLNGSKRDELGSMINDIPVNQIGVLYQSSLYWSKSIHRCERMTIELTRFKAQMSIPIIFPNFAKWPIDIN